MFVRVRDDSLYFQNEFCFKINKIQILIFTNSIYVCCIWNWSHIKDGQPAFSLI